MSSEVAALNKQLAALSPPLVLRSCLGDGNCLYRSVSDQLHGDESHHVELRAMAVARMRLSRAYFELFLLEEEYDSLDDALRAQSMLGSWGGNSELLALAAELSVAFVIHQNGERPWVLQPDVLLGDVASSGGAAPRRVLHLAYDGQHYDSVRVRDAAVGCAAVHADVAVAAAATPPTRAELEVLRALPGGGVSLARVQRALAAAGGNADAAIEALMCPPEDSEGAASAAASAGAPEGGASADAEAKSTDVGGAVLTGAGASAAGAGSASAAACAAAGKKKARKVAAPARRNGPCPCGSMKLFRKCCEGKSVPGSSGSGSGAVDGLAGSLNALII